MIRYRAVTQLARAQLLERIRRRSFLVAVGVAIVAGALYVPPAEAGYLTLGLGNARGVYTAHWLGSALAMMTGAILSLPAFYLAKGLRSDDERSGVGQLLAASPLRRAEYTLGSWLGSWVLLALLGGVVAATGLPMQLIRGESFVVNLWGFAGPYLLLTVPTLGLVAAIATLFEVVDHLRGGPGNIVSFLIWLGTLTVVAATALQGTVTDGGGWDPLGLSIPLASMAAEARLTLPDYDGTFAIGVVIRDGPLQTFVWPGIHWSPAVVGHRLLWVGIALVLALLAAPLFGRFDPARGRGADAHGTSGNQAPVRALVEVSASAVGAGSPATPARHPLWPLAAAELRLLARSQPWWWHLVAAALVVAGAMSPLALAQRLVLTLAWIWPILVWSHLGGRGRAHGIEALLNAAPEPVGRQILAAWLAGVALALLTGAGVLVALARVGAWDGLLGLLAGALVVPALALALGAWSGGGTLFEATYLLAWYMGPLNGFAPLDLFGVTGEARAAGVPLVVLACTPVLLALAMIARHRTLA